MEGRIVRWMKGWMDGRIDRQKDRYMDGWKCFALVFLVLVKALYNIPWLTDSKLLRANRLKIVKGCIVHTCQAVSSPLVTSPSVAASASER